MEMLMINEILENEFELNQIIAKLVQEEEEILHYLALENALPKPPLVSHYRSQEFFELTMDR